MTNAEKYLIKLQEREPQLFPEPLKKSTLTNEDLLEIEKSLGYELPEPYKEFLQSYQLPEIMTVYPSFCGNNIGARFRTFYRMNRGYVPKEGQCNMLVDVEWHNVGGTNAAEWLNSLNSDTFNDSALCEAGYIEIGNLSDDYFLLYDLVEGEILQVHYEEYYDMGYEYGDEVMSGDMPEKLREGIGDCSGVLYKDFNVFLRHICFGEHYDEDELGFVNAEDTNLVFVNDKRDVIFANDEDIDS
ncbi:MAG: SMI1/KNR4 family protein [Lachnospiraceae bacterium]|nr:SMI1/KNR4 family protein [Lachnospiraceae bacterium]